MTLKVSRRAALAGLSASVLTYRANAQTPSASPSPASADLFAPAAFTPGVVPSEFGEVTIPSELGRIVALDDQSLDALLALGVNPIGLARSSNGETVSAYLADKVPADAEYVGGWGEQNIEKLMLLKPDLIFATYQIKHSKAFEHLKTIAPIVAPQVIEVGDATTLQQWEYEHLVWGHTLGMLDKAKQNITGLRDAAQALGTEASAHNGESVVVFRPQPEFPVIMSHKWITGTMLTWSGFVGNNLTVTLDPPHSGDTISLERLDMLNSDWLLAATRTPEMEESLEKYKSNAAFQTVKAFKDKRVAKVPGDLWSGASGVLAGHAMLSDIRRVVIDGDY